MNDELILVAWLLVGTVAMIAGIVGWQKRSESRLTSQATLSVGVDSVARSLAVVLLAAVVVPVGVGVVAELTDPWMRGHAVGAVLVGVFGSGASIVGALAATKRFRQVGALTLTAEALELKMDNVVNCLDLNRPYDLLEGAAVGPHGLPLQVVVVTQDGVSWGFSYGLPVYRRAYGDAVTFDVSEAPSLNGSVRVIHDRLRARLRVPSPDALELA